jgi:hypothetical protein
LAFGIGNLVAITSQISGRSLQRSRLLRHCHRSSRAHAWVIRVSDAAKTSLSVRRRPEGSRPKSHPRQRKVKECSKSALIRHDVVGSLLFLSSALFWVAMSFLKLVSKSPFAVSVGMPLAFAGRSEDDHSGTESAPMRLLAIRPLRRYCGDLCDAVVDGRGR